MPDVGRGSGSIVAAAILLLGAVVTGCGDDESGIGPVGPQGDVGPGEIEIDAGESDGISGSGSIAAEAREVEPFDSVVLNGEGTVLVTQGEAAALTIEADDNLLPYLQSTVVDATLRISTAEGVDIDPSVAPVYRVATPDLVEAELLGAGEIRTAGWSPESFTVSMRGAGDIVVGSLAADTLSVDLAGVGSVTVDGVVGSQVVTMAGVTEYRAADLESRSADIRCGDAGVAVLWAVDDLIVEVTGTGRVSYFGSPSVTRVSGGTESVIPLGAKQA